MSELVPSQAIVSADHVSAVTSSGATSSTLLDESIKNSFNDTNSNNTYNNIKHEIYNKNNKNKSHKNSYRNDTVSNHENHRRNKNYKNNSNNNYKNKNDASVVSPAAPSNLDSETVQTNSEKDRTNSTALFLSKKSSTANTSCTVTESVSAADAPKSYSRNRSQNRNRNKNKVNSENNGLPKTSIDASMDDGVDPSSSETKLHAQRRPQKELQQQQQQRQTKEPLLKKAHQSLEQQHHEKSGSHDNIADDTKWGQKKLDVVKPKGKQPRRRNKNKNNLYSSNFSNNYSTWWKKHIPKDAVDPITLDPLKSLKYPPFALVASEPYVPVDEWPPTEFSTESAADIRNKSTLASVPETEEERQRRILEEQWGQYMKGNQQQRTGNSSSSVHENDSTDVSNCTMTQATANSTMGSDSSSIRRHYNLFDGQALAYYMVSQLQFIDPLNRRDLTRDELVALDRYLRKHGFGDKLNVTEAYDARGITLSTAGATANTAAGRAAILQQEAQNLLNALFRGGRSSSTASVAPSAPSRLSRHDGTNALMRQYQAQEDENAATIHQNHRSSRRHGHPSYSLHQEHDIADIVVADQNDYFSNDDDIGIYGGGGLIVVDDDVNPGLRGDASIYRPSSNVRPTLSPSRGNESCDVHNVASRYALQTEQRIEFPALSATLPSSLSSNVKNPNETDGTATSTISKNKSLPVTKTLLKITNAVKKTDPEELLRQWEARELARKKALLSNLTFGSNMTAWGGDDCAPSQPDHHKTGNDRLITDSVACSGATAAQLERNKAFADALGVQPATIRGRATVALSSGWARPTDTKNSIVTQDEFGNELNYTAYPDELIVRAREYMGVLSKLENKWISFLKDDRSASLPLNKMEKAVRALVHEYASYWNLHTESFDPEPRRYVHCVKLKDTRAPFPLLSEAIRSWKGPRHRPIILSSSVIADKQTEHPVVQSAGQSTRGGIVSLRDISISDEQRKPLSLKPRTQDPTSLQLDGTMGVDTPPTSGGWTNVSGNGGYSLSIGGAPNRTMTEQFMEPSESRFGILVAGRERPKLELKPRTLPVNENHTTEQSDDSTRRRQNERKEQEKREKEEIKRKILELAFASDDEYSNNERSYSNNDDESDWGEAPEPLYSSKDDI